MGKMGGDGRRSREEEEKKGAMAFSKMLIDVLYSMRNKATLSAVMNYGHMDTTKCAEVQRSEHH